MIGFKSLRHALLMGVAAFGGAAAVSAIATPVYAQEVTRTYNIPAQDLNSALREFAVQTGRDVLYPPGIVAGKRSGTAQGQLTERQALEALLAGTGLRFEQTASNGYAVQDPNSPTRVGANQEAPSEEIVVTGSRIAGVSPSSPLTVVTEEEIERSGQSNTGDVIRSLTQTFSGGQNPGVIGAAGSENSNNIGFISSANLRGLGSDATLVLLDGRRLAPSGVSDAVDVSAIPLAAIERIEIVTDGASALYGSDAVAGVVNFRLKRDFDGAETLISYGGATRGGAEEYRANQLFGRDWGTGSVLFDYDYRSQTALEVSERSFSAPAAAINPADDLTPGIVAHNLFAAARQQIGPGELSLLALYSDRVAKRANSTAAFTVTARAHDEQYMFSPSYRVELGSDLDWTTEAVFAGDDVSSETAFIIRSTGTATPDETMAENTFFSVESSLSGRLWNLPSGPLSFAGGIGGRKEELSSSLRSAPTQAISGERDVFYAFGELHLPVFDSLDLDIAGRYESYSDFGEQFSPKLGLTFAPSEELAFRATWSNSFKAPSLNQLNAFRRVTYINLPDPTAPGGSRNTLFLGNSNPNLDAQESDSYTLGVDYEPEFAPGLRLSVTLYDIAFEGRIASPISSAFAAYTQPGIEALVVRNPTASQVTAALAYSPVFNNSVGGAFNPANVQGIVDGSPQNLASLHLRGFDVSIAYETGPFQFGLSLNPIDFLERQLTPTSSEIDLSGTLFNAPSTRARASASYIEGPIALSGFVNYMSESTNNFLAGSPKIDSWITVDASLRYDIQTSGDDSRPFTVALNVLNLLDEDPPFVAYASTGNRGFDTTNASPLGRFISLQLTQRW